MALATSFEKLANEADFKVLYHPRRHLFHLGLRVSEQQLDAGFYDLLASEACLTGLLAIAKGDIPVSHWTGFGQALLRPGCGHWLAIVVRLNVRIPDAQPGIG